MPKSPLKRMLIMTAALAVTLAMLVAPVAAGAPRQGQADGAKKDFTILHTNDEHSEHIPYDLAMDYPGNPTTGGFSRIAKTVGDIKAEKAAAGEPVLTFGAGDWSQGTLFTWLETTEAPELTLMQQIGYDAVTLGNHEVELGPEYLAQELHAARANKVNIPIISSNIKFSGNPPNPNSPDYDLWRKYSAADRQRSNLYIQPYTTRVLSNGLKVGMFGLMGVEAEMVAPGEAPLSFGNTGTDMLENFMARYEKAVEMVDLLRNQKKCDVVVLLSHMGTYEDELMAAFLPDIDVIVGGHSHDLNYPPIIWGLGGTIIVQTNGYTEYLGKLELQYDPAVTEGARVTVRGATPIHMDQNIGTDPAVDAVIANYMAQINAMLGKDVLTPYAETDVNGDGGFPVSDKPDLTESNLGDLIADTYFGAVTLADPGNPPDMAIEANGVIRDGLVKGATGRFSFYDLYRTLPLGGSPYENTPGYPLVGFYLYGSEIRRVMNLLLDIGLNDFFIQTSRLKYTYDPNAADGKKLKGALVDNGSGVYEPIDDGRLYKLAANYYTGMFMGMFNLFPRDRTGKQHTAGPDPMKDFIVHVQGGAELKCWQALAAGVGAMPDQDNDGLPNIPSTYYPPQGRITEMATTFFFAEGTSRPDFAPYITIQNPGDSEARVKITYMKGDATRKLQGITVPPTSRATVNPAEVLGVANDAAHDFSATVECTNGRQIIAERPMYFDYEGMWTGGHDAVGATVVAPTFYFAEGTCRPGFEPYFTVMNPTDEDAQVRITYMKGDGSTASQDVAVTKESRATVEAKAVLGEGDDAAHDFSAKVECWTGQPVVVERPMYFNYKGVWTGGSVVVGETDPSPIYYFAEGSCRPGFDTYFTIQNPGVVDALVKITHMEGDGSRCTQELTVAKQSRATVAAEDVLGEGDDEAHDFSTIVETRNNVPIVVERPMYFDYRGWTGGHDTMGAKRPEPEFFFAEGTCRPGFDPYISVMNPSSGEAAVTVTYQLGDGSQKTQAMAIPAYSRRTFHPADALGVGDDAAHDFSAKVECTNGMPIVAERPMYFNYNGVWTGGSCVVGY